MKFRKKPVVIEAIQFEYSERGIYELQQFCGSALGKFSKQRHPTAKGEAELGTLEDGVHTSLQKVTGSSKVYKVNSTPVNQIFLKQHTNLQNDSIG